MSRLRTESANVENMEQAIAQRFEKAEALEGSVVDLSKIDLSKVPYQVFEKLNKDLRVQGTTDLSLAATKFIRDDVERTCFMLMLLHGTNVSKLDLGENDLYRLYRHPKLGILGIRAITSNLRGGMVNTLVLRHNYLFWPGLLDANVFLNPQKDAGIVQLGIDGIKSLGEGLKSCPEVHALDLSDNMCPINVSGGLAFKGVHALVTVPSALVGSSVHTLNLSKNTIGRMNNNALAQFVGGFQHNSVSTLILEENELASLESFNGSASLQQFSSGFANSSVTQLDLKNNNLFDLSEAGVLALASGFKHTPVSELDIRENCRLGREGTLARWVQNFATGLRGTNIHTVSHDLQGLAQFDPELNAALVELGTVLAENRLRQEVLFENPFANHGDMFN